MYIDRIEFHPYNKGLFPNGILYVSPVTIGIFILSIVILTTILINLIKDIKEDLENV
jgi:hypothetical protein